jgi:large subunit ribosomal protein L10
MALTKQQKQAIIHEVTELLNTSKLTVVAKYKGTTVKQMQALRKQARENNTVVRVIKNRLVIQALSESRTHSKADTSGLTSQLIYAFNADDEVAPAQALANFAKKNPMIEFVGAYTAEGQFMVAADVKSLAALPSKNQLLAGIINTLNSPVNNTMRALSSNLHGLLQGLEAKAK